MGGDIADIGEALADIAPDVAVYIGEFVFGDLYCRPGLSLRERQIATIAALTTLGDTGRQLRFHTGAALNAGVTPAEIVEVVVQMLAFAGNPRVFNAMLAVREVLADRDLLPVSPGRPADGPDRS
jgi:4-carboxymuconolactone decarboxylase